MLLVVGSHHSCCNCCVEQLVGLGFAKSQLFLDEVDGVAALECHGGILAGNALAPAL